MTRDTEYSFVPDDGEELSAFLTEAYEAIIGAVIQPASPERLFIQWVASILLQERALVNYAANQNIPSRAAGANLDALAELTRAGARPAAQAAACTMRFWISQPQDSAILIPAGTRVTDASAALFWETLADHYILPGQSSTDAPVRCQTPGTIGNGCAPGQINTIVDVFDYYVSCENITESGGGADEATDEEYYALLRASMDGYSCAGARGGYIYFARQVSTEIADVIAASPAPGEVRLYVLMEGGTPAGEEVKSAVLAACSADDARPLTDHVAVEDPEVVPYRIAFTYYVQTGGTKSGAEITAAVQEAAEQYAAWQCAKMGRDINPDKLREFLYRTGVKRIELTAPAFTALRDGSGKTVPQVAALEEIHIVNGGYEDE